MNTRQDRVVATAIMSGIIYLTGLFNAGSSPKPVTANNYVSSDSIVSLQDQRSFEELSAPQAK